MRFETAVAIGEGAMGEVFRAYAPDLGVDVAIKMLKRNDPEWVDRLRREAAAMRRIDHPSVCKIIEIGVEDGRHFVAMQYVPGKALDLVSAGLTLDQRIRLLVEVCSAVAAAHAQGLVHRDLKPANVLVEECADGSLKPWVMDFGLVKDSQASTLTVAGQILGTPNYMAPEQARGELSVDRRIDVYALGSMLYFLLTDQHPFEAESTSEVLARLLSERIASPRELRPNLPQALAAICLKAMERSAEDRYGSATELGDDLRAYLEGRPVKARSINFWYYLRHKWQDHRLLIGAGSLLLAVALFASGVAVYNRLQLATATTLAGEFSAVVERNAQMLRLAQMSPDTDLAVFRDRVSKDYEAIAARAESLGRLAQGPVNSALGRLQLQLRQPDQAIARLTLAWDSGEQSAQTALALGLAHAEMLRLALAEVALQRDPQLRAEMTPVADQRWRLPAVSYLARAEDGELEHPDYGNALIAQLGGDYDGARALAEQALERAPWLFEAALLIARGWMEQAVEAELNGEVPAARTLLTSAVQALERANQIAPSAAVVLTERCAVAKRRLKFVAMVDYQDPSAALADLEQICRLAAAADSDSGAALSSLGHGHALRARYLFLQGGGDPLADFELAESYLAQALALQPDSQVVLQETVSMLRMRSFFESDRSVDPQPWVERGLAHVQRLLVLNPTVYAHYNSWGNLLLDLVIYQRDYGKDTRPLINEAIQRFEQALQLRADQPAVVMNLAVGYSLLAEEEMLFDDQQGAAVTAFDSALRTFDRALELDPDDWDIHKNKAMLGSQYARYLMQIGEDPRPVLAGPIAALEASMGGHADDLTGLLALAGSHKYKARAAFKLGERDLYSIQRGLEVVAQGMALDSGRYVDLAQHGLGLGMLEMMVASDKSQAQAAYERAIIVGRKGLAKQSEPDPDLVMASAHLALLAQELGLKLPPAWDAQVEQWAAVVQKLDGSNPRVVQLVAWKAAASGAALENADADQLVLPGRLRIAMANAGVDAGALLEELQSLPPETWWRQRMVDQIAEIEAPLR